MSNIRIKRICPICGQERMVCRHRNKYGDACKHCFQKMIPITEHRGGKHRDPEQLVQHLERGYRLVRLNTDDFFYSMANCYGYVREHRLVMAKHLGRCLQQWEVVHHKNSIKTDNRLENLDLNTVDQHNVITGMQNRIDALIRQNKILKQELANLKKSIS